MFWSLFKGSLVLFTSALLAFGASKLVEMPGEVNFVFYDKEIRASLLAATITLLGFGVSFFILVKLVGFCTAILAFITGKDTAFSRYLKRSRISRGQKSLKNGLIALTEGDNKRSLLEANRAYRALDKSEITTLLCAQAAMSSGDIKLAEFYYKQLLGYKDSQLVALVGLIKIKISDGKNSTALKLAQKAALIKPGSIEVLQTLFKLQTNCDDWNGARRTLLAEKNTGNLSNDIMARREAVLLFAEARKLREMGQIEKALDKVREAIKKSPSLIPAVCMATELEFLSGKKTKASKIIISCWNLQPHPNLARAFSALEVSETPHERFKRFAPLFKNSTDCLTNNIIKAELYIGMEDFPSARRELKNLISERPNSKILILMAAIEKGSGASENIIRGWLTRAASAEREPEWFCGACANIGAWEPICPNCNSFDSYEWGSPLLRIQNSRNDEELLPLTLGDTGQELDLGLESDDEKSQKTISNSEIKPLAKEKT